MNIEKAVELLKNAGYLVYKAEERANLIENKFVRTGVIWIGLPPVKDSKERS